MMRIGLFTLLLFGASLVSLFAAYSTWEKRKAPGGMTLALAFLSIAIWSFFSAMETTSRDDLHRYLWTSLGFIGLCNVAPLLLVFSIQYSESRWPLSPWMFALFWSIPTASIVLAFTNNFHHLIWTGITRDPGNPNGVAIYSHGPWYAIQTFWFLALSIFASYHLLRVAFLAARLYMLQAVIILTSILIPWIGLLVFLLPASPLHGLDMTSLGFAVSSILIVVSFNRLRLLDLIPRARATLVEGLQEGLVVLDPLNRIVDINPVACQLCRTDLSAIGKMLSDVFPGFVAPSGERQKSVPVVVSPPHDASMVLEVSMTPLIGRKGRQTGKVLLFRDITDRRRAEAERERLVAELRDALADVKRLSGLLPICSSCKKIRDDQGYWHQVEDYVREHAEVRFSHGLCPQCAQKLYSGL
ncbi:MAG TPA: histidine kinase N-terminal 7TM domain-containing protein [Spirochaetia bacterium]|nr:histidine kinase N-terminal 7TM domain-containing protein [Spirochaetia bacterium]